MVAPNNDGNHPLVNLCRERLEASLGLQAVLELQEIAGATMARGRYWRSAGRDTDSNKEPQKNNDPVLSTVIDVVGPLVRNLDGRLRVDDWGAFFTTVEGEIVSLESPELNDKLRMEQSWYWRWMPRARLAEWYAALSFRRIVCGYALARWRFATDREDLGETLGVRLDPCANSRITTDPANPVQDLWEHEYLIDSRAISVGQAERYFGPYLKERGITLKSGTPLRDLIAGDQYVRFSLYDQMDGAFASATKGVIVHEMFDEFWKRLTLIIQNPAYKDTDGAYHPTEWLVVWPRASGASRTRGGLWRYGCPYLKLDCYRNPVRAFGDSFPLSIAGPQNLVILISRMHVRNVFFTSLLRWVVQQDALVSQADEDALTSNEMGAIVRVKRNFPVNAAIQPLQANRYDAAADRLLGLAMDAMFRSSAVTPILQGEVTNREPNSLYQTRLQQALVPLESISALDQRRSQVFVSNMADSVLKYHSLTSPRRDLVTILGPRFAGCIVRKDMGRIIAAGPLAVHLKESAFRPQSAEEKEQKLFALLNSGRISPTDPWFLQERYLQTGWEAEAGQSDVYHNALDIVGRLLSGEHVIIRSYYPHAWIKRLCKLYLATAVIRDYTPEQIEALELCVAVCEAEEFRTAQMEAAKQGMLAGGPGAGSGGASLPALPPAPQAPAPPESNPPPMGAPIGGELVGAAG
jgi:hypothetical protein